eukprot:6476676-Amphidinium_carterae.1
MSPHCLFLAILHAAGLPTTRFHVHQLRHSIRSIYEHSNTYHSRIAGHTLASWIAQINAAPDATSTHTTTSYILTTTERPTRQGCTLDALVASQILGATIWVLNSDLTFNLASHPSTPQYSISVSYTHLRAHETEADL